MYGCESWTIKKAECWRTNAFELWCWRRLLRVRWTARRSNQLILKEISPEFSLEGLMLKLKLQYFHHLMRRTATAAAKSLQSCPTLCDPIDSSPPGSPVLGILQARTLEWVAISFSRSSCFRCPHIPFPYTFEFLWKFIFLEISADHLIQIRYHPIPFSVLLACLISLNLNLTYHYAL